MKIPVITGTIRRRILLNYRVAPDVARAVLPARFRPKLVRGQAIAGICLIRLESIRPSGFPELAGISSENTAHRIAVEWEGDDGQTRQGVYVPRRDTDSRLNSSGFHRAGSCASDAGHRARMALRANDDHGNAECGQFTQFNSGLRKRMTSPRQPEDDPESENLQCNPLFPSPFPQEALRLASSLNRKTPDPENRAGVSY